MKKTLLIEIGDILHYCVKKGYKWNDANSLFNFINFNYNNKISLDEYDTFWNEEGCFDYKEYEIVAHVNDYPFENKEANKIIKSFMKKKKVKKIILTR